MYQPLSIMILASVVRNAGYNVGIYDGRVGTAEQIAKDLPEASYYGFSCATPQIKVAKEIASQLKGQTIIGGAHASLLPLDCVNHFDYVVRGEGEEVLLDILGGNAQPGIVTAPRIKDLDSIPYPAWDMVDQPFSDTLFPGERYGKGELAATLIGSRGCPMVPSCAFCGNIHMAPVRFRSAANIIGEIRELIKRGVRHFRFEDDCFTIHPEFQWLCTRMSGLGIHYKAHTRSDLMTPDKARLLALSGCEECGLGVESADDDVLRVNNKKETADDHKRAIKILREAGLRVKTYFVMGLPGETEKTLELNKAFVKETPIDKWTVSTFCPYPGCPVFKSPGKFGIELIDKDFSHWWNYSSNYNHVNYGQNRQDMWQRYKDFYEFLKQGSWKNETNRSNLSHTGVS